MEDLKRLPDEELVKIGREGNCEAMNLLIQRYRRTAAIRARKYYMAGSDRDDVVQEAMIGIFNAVRDFNLDAKVSFATFVNLCIERQIQSAVTRSNRKKHRILSESISLDAESDIDGNQEITNLNETVASSDPENDPEAMAVVSEAVRSLNGFSKLENQVWQLMLSGKSPAEIEKILDKSTKTVDNTIQRIRNKLKKLFQ